MSWIGRDEKGVALLLVRDDAELLRALVEQLLALLGDPPDPGDELAALGIATDARPPDDPVLARLLPDAYQGDDEAAGEFRRYTEAGLRDGKRAAAQTVLDTLRPGERVVLDEGESHAWLRALNDVRLALGTRLEITEERYEEEVDWEDPRYPLYAAYDRLTGIQDALVRALEAG
ncbi:DUF2017 domain-containing protein [Actinomadura craniellae]|uniref:DUF2017 domain-containing protein n=1 Tax=Actinomadura craniellae TaxID=2231787 RepID=A0A365HA35_9ACTN|nr:DUF2017 domain-containing protein [Actinomadura craniellae]RAY15796.1 DUF2017 domain-containing protein [Actinomadura craniellae]